MSDLIYVELSEGPHRPGGQLDGVVVAELSRPDRTNGINLALIKREFGRGTESEEVVARRSLPLDQGQGHGDRRVPFSFPIPEDATPGFDGVYVQVAWAVRAELDVSWAVDPKTIEDFRIEPPATLFEAEPSGRREERVGVVRWTPFFAPLVLGLMLGLIFLIAPLEEIFESAFVAYCVIGILALMLIVSIAYALHSVLASLLVPRIELAIAPSPIAPGHPFSIRVAFTPRVDLELNAVRVALIGLERAVWRAGTDTETYTHVFYREALALEGAGRAQRGHALHRTAHATLDPGALPSFTGKNHFVEWTIEVRVDVPNWPDVIVRRPVTVAASGLCEPSLGGAGARRFA